MNASNDFEKDAEAYQIVDRIGNSAGSASVIGYIVATGIGMVLFEFGGIGAGIFGILWVVGLLILNMVVHDRVMRCRDEMKELYEGGGDEVKY